MPHLGHLHPLLRPGTDAGGVGLWGEGSHGAGWWRGTTLRRHIVTHLSFCAVASSCVTPTFTPPGVDIGRSRTGVGALQALALVTHVTRATHEAVLTVAHLVGDPRVARASLTDRRVQALGIKEAAVLALLAHLLAYVHGAQTLRAILGYLHILAVFWLGYTLAIPAHLLMAGGVGAVIRAAACGH